MVHVAARDATSQRAAEAQQGRVGGSPDELLSLADRALYAAKAGGRDRVVVDGEPVDGAEASAAPAG